MLSDEAERGRLAEALAAATRPDRAWERGWVLAAMGRFGEALATLTDAAAGPDAPRALGTRASVYRQLSLHELAERDDETALGLDPAGDVGASLLVGRVADGLGLGLRDEWPARLAEARRAVAAHGDWRQRLRLAWVTGETALYEGDAPGAAPHFAEAVTRAVDRGARRHEAKSHLFLAAAHGAHDDVAAAVGHARAAVALARDCGAAALVWPAELVLAQFAGRVGGSPGGHLAEARTVLSGIVDGLPGPMAALARERDPARWLLADPAR